MPLDFPPRSTHESEIKALLNVLASVVEGRTATYVSAPITSGKRYLDWHAQRGKDTNESQPTYRDVHSREVIKPNRVHAQQVVQKIRRSLAGVLIDPTAFDDIPGWTQDDYRDFWSQVIKKYVNSVIFINGWEHSNGCSYEFFIAQRNGITTLDEDFHPLTFEQGLELIQAAINEMRRQGLSTIFLERVAEGLTRLQCSKAEELCTE